MGGAIPIISAIAGIAGTVSSIKQSKDAKKAASKQEDELDRQKAIQAKQDKLVAEQKAKEESRMQERRARLAEGHRGLLFQGEETGVQTSNVLGG